MADAQSYFLQAEKYLENRQIFQAVECYELALSIDPEHEDSLLNLASCYITEGDYQQLGLTFENGNIKALSYIKTFLATKERKGTLNKGDADSYFVAGMILRNLGRIAEAVPYYESAVRLDEKDEASFSELGLSQKELGRYKDAIESYKKAAALIPNKKGTLVSLAYLYLEIEQFKEAENAIAAGLALDPNDADLHYKLGIAKGSQGQHEAARDSFRRAVELAPDAAEAHYNLWLACLRCKDTKTGSPEEVCEGGGFLPSNGDGWVSSKAVDRQEEAFRHLERAAELNPRFCGTLAEIHKNHRRYQKALENFEAFCKAADGNATISRPLAEKSRKYIACCRKKIELFGPKEE